MGSHFLPRGDLSLGPLLCPIVPVCHIKATMSFLPSPKAPLGTLLIVTQSHQDSPPQILDLSLEAPSAIHPTQNSLLVPHNPMGTPAFFPH